MPTTIADAFAAAGLIRQGVVKWKTKPKSSAPGVYMVSLDPSPTSCECKVTEAPLAADEFQKWLKVRPELTLDGDQPTARQLMDRVRRFWIPDEVILYIGLAGTSLSQRVGQYYNTPIGRRSPHRGGYFLKLLSNLSELWVHYAECADFKVAERRMLQLFCSHLSQDSRQALHDPAHPFPFANLEWPRGPKKSHGLRGACGPKSKTQSVTREPRSEATPVIAEVPSSSYRTQRVTTHDLRHGRIRIPTAGSAPTKALFPSKKKSIRVVLAGQLVQGSWDPRMGPDRERSGVLRVGDVLRELVRQDEVLLASAGEDGTVRIFTPADCSVFP